MKQNQVIVMGGGLGGLAAACTWGADGYAVVLFEAKILAQLAADLGVQLHTSTQVRRILRSYEPACSGVVLYLGLDRRYEQLLHYNFIFSKSPKEEFDCLFRRGEPAPDPTCYVCAPARTGPTVARPGGEALYVLVHTPYLWPHQVSGWIAADAIDQDFAQCRPTQNRAVPSMEGRSG